MVQIQIGSRVSSPSTDFLGTVLEIDAHGNAKVEWDSGFVTDDESVECLKLSDGEPSEFDEWDMWEQESRV